MGITGNVVKNEKVVRIILGIILIPSGFFLTGSWRTWSIVAGAWLIVTAFVGY
jgi:hypothetical protein